MAESMIYIKIHGTDNGLMVGMCDSSLIDKVLTEGDVEINIKDYSDFYKGELVSAEKAHSMIKPEMIHSANIIGKESVEIAIKSKIILKESVKKVNKIPYAYAFKIKY
jgi:hypothetical protein